jgi:hypothetical protein
MGKRRTEWRRHKAHLEEITRWTVDLLEETETRLDRLLKQATTRANDSHDLHDPLPEGVFRETREEKDLTWIRSIMRICSVGGEMEVRELLNTYEYDGDNVVFVKGSALCALNGTEPELGEKAMEKLVDALDSQI